MNPRLEEGPAPEDVCPEAEAARVEPGSALALAAVAGLAAADPTVQLKPSRRDQGEEGHVL